MTPALSYQDVYLVPRYSELRSRSQADVSVDFLGRQFRLPVIPANMQSVINEDIAHWLSENDHPYIYHRFSDTFAFVERANQTRPWKLISISVGVKEEDKNLLREIVVRGLRVDWITIDIAHAHHVSVKEMIQFIKGLNFPSCILDRRSDWSSCPIDYKPKIIAGNVATPEAVRDLAKWGASCVKVGIAMGKACRTFNETGFGVPMFTCVQNCVNPHPCDLGSLRQIPIIADGGVRENGDIAKALVAAHGVPVLVMAGSLFASCIDAPGENVYSESQLEQAGARAKWAKGHQESINEWNKHFTEILPWKKRYHGSASHIQKGERKHIEGVQLEIPCNGLTYAEKYQEIKESLSSSCSYAGGNSLAAFRDVEWVSLK